MAQSTQSPILFSPSSHIPINTITQQPSTFLFDNICQSASNKLMCIALCYIFIGIISIGLEAKLLSLDVMGDYRPTFSYVDLFGIYLLALGVILLILCRHQVYVLIGIFTLLFFELNYLIRRVVTNSIDLFTWDKRCTPPYAVCNYTVQTILIISSICAVIAVCLTIFNMVVIKQACDPRSRVASQQQPMPVSYSNLIPTVTLQ